MTPASRNGSAGAVLPLPLQLPRQRQIQMESSELRLGDWGDHISFCQKCASPPSSSISFFWMVLAVCAGFHTQIPVGQVPQGRLSAPKSFGESPDGLSGVVLDGYQGQGWIDGLGHSLHVSGRSDSLRSARSRVLLQTAPRPQFGLDPLDRPQFDAAV